MVRLLPGYHTGRPVNDAGQVIGIFRQTAFSQPLVGFAEAVPCWITVGFLRSGHTLYFQQISCYSNFAALAYVAESTLGVQIGIEVARLDSANCPRLFQGLAGCGGAG